METKHTLKAVNAELLEACKATIDNCANCDTSSPGMVDIYDCANDTDHHEICPCCGPARAAIAKALPERTYHEDLPNLCQPTDL